MCQAITVPVSPANRYRRIWLKAGPAFGPWVAESLIVIGAALAISVGPSWLRHVVYGSAKQTFGHSQHRRVLAPLARLAIVPHLRRCRLHSLGSPIVQRRYPLGMGSAPGQKTDTVLRHRVLVRRLVPEVHAPPDVGGQVWPRGVDEPVVENNR